ncbi:META domain-containing protein [Pseudobacter ginsenosidimutans]|uniref:META domain-containing protein n=1 Tax=Pseudobacter ginsenosidimutans TaxID=661488 RepID=A0A4Q7MSS2_9BACT|nr:META domain-containing protein [Pseudobacter ginsenosidimutans]RZS71872.1 META domain-containing protein [Pseudobacter ginsenosidimutans]
MRTLIIVGAALLLVAAVAPALTNYHRSVRKSDNKTDVCSILPLNSLRDLYVNNRGNSFRRFHPELVSNTAGPSFEKLKVIRTSFKPDTSLNGLWYLQPALPSDTATGTFPSLRFNLKTKKFSGNTGCNTMSGSFTITDSSFQFNDNVQVSKKICTGFNEAAFLKSLFMANRYTIDDSVMTLWFDQTQLSRWTRKPYKGAILNKA